jgi:hypothetical protein
MSDASKKPKQSFGNQLAPIGAFFMRFIALWFILLLAAVYGFVLFNIQAAVTINSYATC